MIPIFLACHDDSIIKNVQLKFNGILSKAPKVEGRNLKEENIKKLL